ncbi:hypothetical protein FDG2_4234 [Candidatus Protofrankia californiensis]|uniref:Uncharacterized protein n=1 Tax=Candidatus Protofrankia californiensis TaxID=1839754 RepID=A0A1C3P474_9ACTN|nr:hypothetical protein FDG2_4234 [Candidatus Protofrankia californiensis]
MMLDEQRAVRHRLYAVGMLAQDAAYEQHPAGDPPLLSADLRRALLAVLAVTPEPLLRAGHGVTESEAAAFLAGQQAAVDAVHTALARAWFPTRPRHGRQLSQPAGTEAPTPIYPTRCDPTQRIRPEAVVATRREFPLLDGLRIPDEPTKTIVAGGVVPDRLVVVDGDGVVVAEFDGAAWEAAHAWVHARVVEPLTRRPVCIEDHRNRQTWEVDVGSCRHTLWAPGWRSEDGTACPLVAPTDR